MSALWLPEQTPPQITEHAAESVLSTMLENGVIETTANQIDRLESEDEILGDYLDELGGAIDEYVAYERLRRRLLKAGASCAFFAYRETGYFQTTSEEAFTIGSLLASAQGIPEAYLETAALDPQLNSLIQTVTSSKDIAQGDSRYARVFTIGAGCTRYYLQQTLAA